MREELMHLLREIAFGHDPKVTPDHRLRAAEWLDRIGEPPGRNFYDEVAQLDGAELDAQVDDLTAAAFILLPEDERRRRWPSTMAALDGEVEHRVRERVALLQPAEPPEALSEHQPDLRPPDPPPEEVSEPGTSQLPDGLDPDELDPSLGPLRRVERRWGA